MLILGPVIGLVTDNSAYILCESSVACTLTFRLESVHSVLAFEHEVQELHPSTVHVEGLIPATSYTVRIEGMDCVFSGSFRTSPSSLQVVSCNNFRKGNRDAWDFLLFPTRKRYDMMLHIGDQVYQDYGNDAFDRAKKASTHDAKVEILRGSYRQQWSSDVMRRILSTRSNVMVGDDHDIVDSWDTKIVLPDNWQDVVEADGWEHLSSFFSSQEEKAIVAALQVYSEYQLSLCGRKYPGSWILEVAQRRYFLYDLRYSRCMRQTSFPDADVYVLPVSPYFLPSLVVNRITRRLLKVVGQHDIGDMWQFHSEDRIKLEEALVRNPQAILICGDAHCCGEAVVQVRGHAHRQYITSGISTPSSPWLLRQILRTFPTFFLGTTRVSPEYWCKYNNFLSIRPEQIELQIPELLK